MALPRSVKVKRVLLVSLVAKFLTAAVCVRASANAKGSDCVLLKRGRRESSSSVPDRARRAFRRDSRKSAVGNTEPGPLQRCGGYHSVYSRFAPIFRLLLKVAVDQTR